MGGGGGFLARGAAHLRGADGLCVALHGGRRRPAGYSFAAKMAEANAAAAGGGGSSWAGAAPAATRSWLA